MTKIVRAVKPYIHPGHLNFKLGPYEAWERIGGEVAEGYYPFRFLHGCAFRMEIPTLWRNKENAMLMFVEPVSITFDTFPYYATHEIIPFIWDCWPCYYDKIEKWMRKHNVRTAIFTSSHEMEEMRKRLPYINFIHCPEAIDTSIFKDGKELKDRSIDLLEFGRSNEKVINCNKWGATIPAMNHVCTKVGDKFIYTNEQLHDAMGDAKITLCFPKCMTHPKIAEGIETLTQRYWEAMLSRIVIVGHCPKELEELIGYNPVVEVDFGNPKKQIMEIVSHIEEYQNIVNRNRDTALRMGDWQNRMKELQERLTSYGYKV